MNNTHSTQVLYNEHIKESKVLFGFWIYILSDVLLFASLFATYAVLHSNTFGGSPGAQLFSLPLVFLETMILLTSSFTCGIAMLAVHRNRKIEVLGWFVLTFLLGVAFLLLEWNEFTTLVFEGNSWRNSGFLSAFFTLVGTHGLHVVLGLLWMLILLYDTARRGLTSTNSRRLMCLSLFWHFLDVVWIGIFTFVYLMPHI